VHEKEIDREREKGRGQPSTVSLKQLRMSARVRPTFLVI
jgi:hypothetical protein